MAWVENDRVPRTILHAVSNSTTRPLCAHPEVAVYAGSGSTDDAANFRCGANPVGADGEDFDARVNQRLFDKPLVPGLPPAMIEGLRRGFANGHANPEATAWVHWFTGLTTGNLRHYSMG